MPSDVAAPAAAAVLVADFDGDRDGAVVSHLVDQLSVRSGIQVRRTKAALKVSGSGGLVERLVAAAETGRKWLTAAKAEILLWGEVADDGVVKLRFLTAVADAEGKPGTFGLGDTLELPGEFDNDLDDIVHISVLAALGPVKQGPRQRLCEMLIAAADRADRFVEAPPPDLGQSGAASVLTCLGNAFAVIWRLTGDTARIERAVWIYKAALANLLKDEAPLAWAMAQNHLAAALEATAERNKEDTENLVAAAAAYRAATQALGRHEHPNDWALAHVHLGMVLYKLGRRTGKAAVLKDSCAAFEAALGVYTRAAMPGQWAEVMNQIGVVMMALGEQVGGNTILEQSVATFRKTLEVRGREATPLLWAQTANNLGAAAFALAKRNGNPGLLNEACSCLEGAIEVYTGHGRAKTVAVIQKNLQRVQRLLETRRP